MRAWHALQAVVCLVALAAAGLSPSPAEARIHDLKVVGDARKAFNIETFGLVEGGEIVIQVKALQLIGPSNAQTDVANDGFIVRRTGSESDSVAFLEAVLDYGKCIRTSKHKGLFEADGDVGLCQKQLENGKDSDASECNYEVVNTPAGQDAPTVKITVAEGYSARYQLLFQRCSEATTSVSFAIEVSFANPGPNYLSAGDTGLPSLFMVSAAVYGAALASWIYFCRENRDNVHQVHIMMAALGFAKLLSLFFESLSYSAIASYGRPIGWNVLFYIFYFVKALMLFVVILLVGTGWSFVKPFLNDQEKKIFMVVIPLQVLENIAYIILSESAPGSVGFLTWLNLLHFIDLICCCAVLFPIVWSIKRLASAGGLPQLNSDLEDATMPGGTEDMTEEEEQAALRDAAEDAGGRANLQSLSRLRQFREFYLVLIAYIYFTRIVVDMIASSVPFQLEWLGAFFNEVATLSLLAFVAYRFRPVRNNPYMPVRAGGDDDEDDAGSRRLGRNGGSGRSLALRNLKQGGADVENGEFGLDDDEDEGDTRLKRVEQHDDL